MYIYNLVGTIMFEPWNLNSILSGIIALNCLYYVLFATFYEKILFTNSLETTVFHIKAKK